MASELLPCLVTGGPYDPTNAGMPQRVEGSPFSRRIYFGNASRSQVGSPHANDVGKTPLREVEYGLTFQPRRQPMQQHGREIDRDRMHLAMLGLVVTRGRSHNIWHRTVKPEGLRSEFGEMGGAKPRVHLHPVQHAPLDPRQPVTVWSGICCLDDFLELLC
ncbi:MAG TPA: hypothetical protein VFE58_12950 [Tepidisphaeraceae bacterium]|nr:hypothetical protein [Tepidisphaeraceae bacterium]